MSNKIIPIYEPWIDNEEEKEIIKTIRSGWISSKGPVIKEFEEKFSKWLNVKNSLTTSNGTTALHLALVSIGITKGDEVIVPDLTFISTANAVKFTGANPIFADINPKTWNINPDSVVSLISEKTKAIIPVHLYGNPANMEQLLKIAKENELFIVEDAAEAIGAIYQGKKVGTIGDVGCFSFYGNKIITTGEGGMVVSNNDEYIDKMFILREHGMSKRKRYWHDVIGFNYRMTSLQASVGISQLRKIEKIIKRKREIATLYSDLIRDKKIPVEIQQEEPKGTSVWWMFSILIKTQKKRDRVMKELYKSGIETRPLFYPISSMPPYYSNSENKHSYNVGHRGINLPSSPLLTEEQIELIINKLGTVLN